MSSTVTFYQQIRYENTSTGQRDPIGSLNVPITLSLSGDTYLDNTFSIGTGTTKEILRCGTSAGDDIAAFTFLYIRSDKDVKIEFLGGGTAANNSNLYLVANTPFVLWSDNTLTYNASGGFAGSASDIQKINVSNGSGSTATLRIFAAN